MNRNRELKASIFYLIGNISTKAIAFVTIPIFTRMLSTTEYGIVNTYSSWVSIVSVIVNLSLFDSFRTAFSDDNAHFESYCASTIRLSGIFSFGALILATLGVIIFPSIRHNAWMIYACILQAYGTFCLTSMSTKYLLQFQYLKRAFCMIVPNFVCAGLAVVLMYYHSVNRYVWRIASYVFVYTFIIIITLWSCRKEPTEMSYWRKAICFSIPLVFHGLSLVILSSSDRIMITAMSGASESGVYSLVYNLGLVSMAISTSLEGIWVPWFIKKFKEKKYILINKKAHYLIENITVVVICIMLVSPEILQVMASEQYWSGKPILFPIIVASYIMFLYDLAVNVELQSSATSKIAQNTIVAALTNLLLNFILIPFWGAIAAAYTTVIAYSVSLIMHYYYAQKIAPGIFPMKEIAPYLGIVLCVSLLCGYIWKIDFAWLRWGTALVIGFVYLILMFWKRRFIAFQIRINDTDALE